MGIYPILGKKLGHEFPSLGKYSRQNWENFVLEKIEITILGKYWEILTVHSTCPNFFRLRVVAHFSSGIVERAKRERA